MGEQVKKLQSFLEILKMRNENDFVNDDWYLIEYEVFPSKPSEIKKIIHLKNNIFATLFWFSAKNLQFGNPKPNHSSKEIKGDPKIVSHFFNMVERFI